MPLYEYTCQTCYNTFEKLRPVSELDADAPCTDCGSASQRQLSVFAAVTVSARGESSPVAGGGGCCGGGGGGGCACAG